jgi:predicted Zn-ribbon and HTH transcriptional regulator
MNGPAFIGELEQVVRPYHEKLVNHPAIEKINRGEAPRELIQRYLAYQFYNTRETVARILNRANRAPNDAVRDTLVKHASEELGHPEMALLLAPRRCRCGWISR